MKPAATILFYCLLLAGVVAAEPLAVSKTQDVTGRDWPRTFVTCDLAKSAAPFNALGKPPFDHPP